MSFNPAAAAMFSVVVAIGGAASAKEPVARVGNDFVVQYGDLDLNTLDGQEAFADRLDEAVERSCWAGPRRALHEISACERDLMEQVVEQGPQPVRTAIIAERARNGA